MFQKFCTIFIDDKVQLISLKLFNNQCWRHGRSKQVLVQHYLWGFVGNVRGSTIVVCQHMQTNSISSATQSIDFNMNQ